MKNVLPILCCVLLLIGGTMLTAPASQTIEVPVTYTVADSAPPAPAATHNPVDPAATTGLVPNLADQLATNTRLAGAGGGYHCNGDSCDGGQCGDNASASSAEDDGGQRLLGRVASRVRGVGSAILGVERRQARRAARRGE